MTDLVVVGAGITGLAAAWQAQRRGADVVVLDGAETAGGKLRTSPVAGLAVDESADAFLARVPEAVTLCNELGLQAELVSPATGQAYIWIDGALRPLPADQLLGVPTDLDRVADAGILSERGLGRAAQDLAGSPPDGGAADGSDGGAGDEDQAGDDRSGDETVGALVRRRLGDEVHDRLVAPLVGSIWAGDCDRLSLEVTAPALAEARRRDASLIRGAREVREAATATGQPVFLAPRGGMATLVDALVQRLGDRVHLGQPVERITPVGPNGARWRVDPAGVIADAVVVATPAATAAGLLRPHLPAAADTLAAMDHAQVTLVTMAVPREAVDHPLDGSGFLVPASSGMLLTACSWASSKWEHLAGDGTTVVLRASAGRDGDERALKLGDAELLQAIQEDLGTTMGLRGDPIDVRIGRWRHAFPQPRPGHLNRVARLEQDLVALVPRLAAAGAWSRGVGIPACIRDGQRAAATVLDALSG